MLFGARDGARLAPSAARTAISRSAREIAAAIPPFTIPAQAVLRLNGSALLFSLGAAFATALLCGFVPALRAVRRDVSEPLKDSSKASTTGARRHRLTDVLVAAEVAISIVLLI